MKLIKKWFFPLFCFLGAVLIAVIVFINIFIIKDETVIILTLSSINCLTPALLLIIIGVVNLPIKEENKNE